MTYEERFRRAIAYEKEYATKMLKDYAIPIDHFKQLADAKGISLHDEDFQYKEKIGIVVKHPGILWLLYPELISDKDGLVEFSSLLEMFGRSRFVPGYLYTESCMLMVHPYFRRGYSESQNFYPGFLEHFWRIKDPAIVHSIALDSDRVWIDVDGSRVKEFDTWYGPAFNSSVMEIPDGNIKLRPPLDLDPAHIRLLFADVHSLILKWSTSKDGIKNFYAEEFKTDEETVTIDGVEYFPARYVHAEFDPGTKTFRHFDGALHLYTLDEYIELRDNDLNYNSKSKAQIKGISKKVFMLNGKIETKEWIELISYFMSGNPLVFEYFQGSYPKELEEILFAIRADGEN